MPNQILPNSTLKYIPLLVHFHWLRWFSASTVIKLGKKSILPPFSNTLLIMIDQYHKHLQTFCVLHALALTQWPPFLFDCLQLPNRIFMGILITSCACYANLFMFVSKYLMGSIFLSLYHRWPSFVLNCEPVSTGNRRFFFYINDYISYDIN